MAGFPLAVVRPHTAKTVTQLALLKVVPRKIVTTNALRLAATPIESKNIRLDKPGRALSVMLSEFMTYSQNRLNAGLVRSH